MVSTARKSRSTATAPLPQVTLTTGDQIPLFHGYVATIGDALILIEGVLRGRVGRLTAKPQRDQHKEQLVKDGAVIIFEETETGIKRWTDSFTWSQTRSWGQFMLYREATDGDPWKHNKELGLPIPTRATSEADIPVSVKIIQGSLPDGRKCRGSGFVAAGGLTKRTITIPYLDRRFHVLNYYRTESVQTGQLIRPTESADLQELIHEISEPLLNAKLYNKVNLITEVRAEDGKKVYVGERIKSTKKAVRARKGRVLSPTSDYTEVDSAAASSPSVQTSSVSQFSTPVYRHHELPPPAQATLYHPYAYAAPRPRPHPVSARSPLLASQADSASYGAEPMSASSTSGSTMSDSFSSPSSWRSSTTAEWLTSMTPVAFEAPSFIAFDASPEMSPQNVDTPSSFTDMLSLEAYQFPEPPTWPQQQQFQWSEAHGDSTQADWAPASEWM